MNEKKAISNAYLIPPHINGQLRKICQNTKATKYAKSRFSEQNILCIYKWHKYLQREITLTKSPSSPYFFIEILCLADINVFARFDESPSITLY